MHPASLTTDELARQCRFQMLRRSGPGGQHRNKVETAVVATHLPTNISAEANERRSQAENRKQGLWRLRLKLALEIRTPIELHDAPSPLWQSRCSGGKLAINPEHEDFPALLAEALNRMATAQHDPKQAAESLGCSASQLIKLLKQEPRAFAQVNAARGESGLHPLK